MVYQDLVSDKLFYLKLKQLRKFDNSIMLAKFYLI